MDENFTDPKSEDAAAAEEAETESNEAAEREGVLLTADGQKFLNQTRPWVRFLSIMVFIVTAFMVIGAFMMFLVGITGNLFGSGNEALEIMPGEGFFVGLVYTVMAVLYIAPGILLFRYASAIKILESTRTSEALERALKYQKSFWLYVGIFTVIFLIVTAAAITFFLAVSFFMLLNG
jgi:flagellar basal body-associated protein FliL